MTTHTITPAVGEVCRGKEKAGLRRSPRGLHTRTRLSSLLRLNLDSPLNTTWSHSDAVQFPCLRYHWRCQWVRVKATTRIECHDPKCPSARRLSMVREDTCAPREDATYAWMAAVEAVGCTRSLLTMW
ncbi:uncharacterized protein TNCV_561631 [Trichonephila clavipes]|uniref:Uncharacterized protein n=1 Tax=Trichonephila clavipes TaxID=2585209 RepID=A0A8X6SAP3_TRICX|nr:uncharacterized protein TNCV_561631 [Trichonephila clavipes]